MVTIRALRVLSLFVVASLLVGCTGAGGVPASGEGSPSAVAPTASTTPEPTSGPTSQPTAGPTAEPTAPPTAPPTSGPTLPPASEPTLPPTAAPTASAGPAPTASAAGRTVVVRAYFLMNDAAGEPRLVPVLRTIPATPRVAQAALEQLVAGPTAKERAADPPLTTTVPAATDVLGVTIANGLATVNLSAAFASGGGTMSMGGRLAQLTYTATQFASVDRVRLELDGEPVTVFSGEGLILDQPLTRDMYAEWLPAIFVDRPAWGASLLNPGPVAGAANVFEAVFRVAVLDHAGRTLVERRMQATCGTGCWGTFSTSLAYDVSGGQWGTLRVWALSARDGSPVDVREYPVWLTP